MNGIITRIILAALGVFTLTIHLPVTCTAHGNMEMEGQIRMYMDMPNSPDAKQQFADIAYATQICQAVGTKTMTENQRRWQNRLNSRGEGNTMGSMYWMLADIWQAPTWASIEYGGKWKVLHYFANKFFAPTIISPYIYNDNLDIFVIVDELEIAEIRHPVDNTLHFKPKSNPRPFSLFDLRTWGDQETAAASDVNEFSGNVYMDVYSWHSMDLLTTVKIPFQVNSSSESIYTRDIDSLASEAGCASTAACVLNLHFGDSTNGPSNWLPLTTFNDAEGLQTASIQVTEVMATDSEEQYTVTITTDNIAPFVWLEAYGIKGRFSDNAFIMFDPTMTLTFYAWETTSVDDLTAALTVKSLQDSYN